MKQEYKNIDDLLRDSLEGYSPPPSPGLWSKISLGLHLRNGKIYLSILLLVITAGIIYLVQAPTEGLSSAGSAVEAYVAAPEDIQEKPISQQAEAPELISGPVPGGDQPARVELQPAKPVLAPAPSTQIPGHPSEGQKGEVVSSYHQPIAAENYFDSYPGLERMEIPEMSPRKAEADFRTFCFYNFPYAIAPRNAYGIGNHNMDYGFSKSRSIIFQLSPEVIFAGQDRKDMKTMLNFDLSYLMEGKDGFVQAGAGIGISRDNGIFDVSYDQYDSIGFYEQVNSFYFDPEEGETVFNTSTEGIYDTVSYAFQETNKNTYYYLRIPVTAGLKVYGAKRVALYAEIGGTYSILLRKHEPEYTYSNDKATRIEVIDNTPQRIQSNIQLSIGAGLKYRMTDRLDLRLDGFYNYYWNALVERQYQQKSPWSVSLRLGFIYNF